MADIQSTRAPHSVGSEVVVADISGAAVVNVAFGVAISVIVVNVGVVPVNATVVTFGVTSVVSIVVLKSGVVRVPNVVAAVVASVVFIATVVVTVPSSCSIQLTTRLTS